jgi:putative FmdB family regulatory protein
MPTYDYKCPSCHARREIVKPLAELNRTEPCHRCKCGGMERLISAPMVRGDLPGYDCPITGKWIEGRRAHEENLARHGCRVFEAGEREAFIRQRQADERDFDRRLDETAEAFIANLPTEKRDRLAGEMEGGITAEVVRESVSKA